MRRLKLQFIVILLALFAFGSVASSTVAHCDHVAGGSIDAGMDMTGAHHSSDMDTEHHSSTDGDANAMNCHDCAGSPCNSQTALPVGADFTLHQSTNETTAQKDIHLKLIELSRIPDPPKALS